MRRILGFFIFFIIMMTYHIYAGNIYYVDATNGHDSNSGISEANAWQTIAKVNKSLFFPGDKILFKRGEIWREQLVIPSSGTAGNPVTFGTYGTGPKPIINGADIVTDWMNHDTNIWKSCFSTTPNLVIVDNHYGNKKTEINNLRDEYDWYYDSSNNLLYLYANSNPDIVYANPGIEASKRSYGILSNGKNYINLQNLNFKCCNSDGVLITNYTGSSVTNFLIDSCKSESNYRHGFHIFTEPDGANINNGIISNSETYKNGGTGIKLTFNGTAWTIENNETHENCHNIDADEYGSGIKLFRPGMSNVIIQDNEVHDEGLGNTSGDIGLGIWVDTCGNGIVVRYNKIYNNRYHGITIEKVTGASVYYNLCYSNDGVAGWTAGVLVSGDCNSCKVYNNVSYGNEIGIQSRGDGTSDSCVNNIIKNNIASCNNVSEFSAINGGENDGTNGYGNVYTHNCFGAEASNFIEWGDDVYKSTYDVWESTYGSGTNSVETDPVFTDASSADFLLKLTSPCIDAGTNVALTRDYAGNTVPVGWCVDIGAYEYQDETPGNPVASFSAYPIDGIPPLEVNFDASASYDPDGNITSYEWGFGDGNTGSGINVSHTYQGRGTYTAKLTVTDHDELSASESQEIKVGTPPVALFEASPSSGNAPLKVEFDASYSYDTDGEVVDFTWNFGDGTQAHKETAAHTYYAYGKYTATLSVTDDDGLSDSTSKQIKVIEKPYPPLNVEVTRVINRDHSFYDCFYKIEWSKNPKNNGKYNIVKYKIYRKVRTAGDNTYALIKEVNNQTFEYEDKSFEYVKDLNIYTYAVSAVDDKNRESALKKPSST